MAKKNPQDNSDDIAEGVAVPPESEPKPPQVKKTQFFFRRARFLRSCRCGSV